MTQSTNYRLRTLIYAGENGFYCIVMQGKATLPELRKVLTEAAVFPDTRLELWLIDELELDLSSSDVALLAETVKGNPYHPEKTAVVTRNDLLFGLSRVFSGHRESEDTLINVFRETDAAMEWLQATDALPDISAAPTADWTYFGPCATQSGSQ